MVSVLVDADTIYYRAAFRKNKKEIRSNIRSSLLNIKAHTWADNMFIAVKGFGNFRKDLYPKYKANRKVDPELKPYLEYGWNYMIDEWDAVKADGMEADDLISIWAAECRASDVEYIVAGIDKDLLQIPGRHYNYHKETFTDVDESTAHYNLMLQCLTGDNSDNIPGIKGIGPKKAERILDGVATDSMWSRVRATWVEHNAGDPTLSRTLLTMLTEFPDASQDNDEASQCEQDVLEEQEEQNQGVPGVSGSDPGVSDSTGSDDDMALRGPEGDLPSDSSSECEATGS